MRVTRIEALRRRYRIYLNDEPAFCLTEEQLAACPVREGEEFSESLRQVLFGDVLPKGAALRALRLLKVADRTEWQLRRRLRQDEYPEEVIDKAIAYVKSFHYVDDLRYALRYAEARQGSRSRQQLRADLTARGVKGQVIDEAFARLGEEDQSRLIRQWMEKKHYDPETADEAQTRRFVQFLLRKGLSYGEIRKVCGVWK